MKIGFSVEGSTDRALIEGLRERWCPQAILVEGHFRGTTGQSRRREIPRVCQELQQKSVALIIFLTDSNGPDWRQVQTVERARCQPQYEHLAIFAVCLRNVECWLAADPDHIANRFGRQRIKFTVEDPKGEVESAFGITRLDRREKEIAEFVRVAPLQQWLRNQSFEDFFEQLWSKSRELGCTIENLRERRPP